MIRQGEIYLVDFGQKYNSEIGKIRPAVVMQNNFFNKAIKSNVYKQVLVAPLSTLPIEDDYRIFIKARDNLKKDSFMIANWICTLDFEHILIDRGLIAKLDEDEFGLLKQRVCTLM
jgi:mRNA interferase MazF